MTIQNTDSVSTTAGGSDKAIAQPSTRADDPAGDLSRQVFANPADFLKTLNSDLLKMNSGSGDITRQDLIDFSADAKEAPKDRAAASIAADRFDALRKMATLPGETAQFNTNSAETLSALDSGKTFGLKWPAEVEGGLATFSLAGVTAVLGAATAFVAPELPLAGIVGAAATVAAGGLTAALGREVYNYPGQVDALAAQDHATLASWKEINGHA
jgi:hypothetical protein